MKFRNWKLWLRWLGIATLAVLVVAATVYMRSRPAPNTGDSLPDSEDSAMQSETVSPQIDSVQSDSPQGLWEALDTESIGQGNGMPESVEAMGDMPVDSDSNSDADSLRELCRSIRNRAAQQSDILLGKALPLQGKNLLTEMQMRLDAVEKLGDIDLRGLPYAARCALLMEKRTTIDSCCFGLVDLNSDGIPEFFQQSYLRGEVSVYDIAGTSAHLVLEMPCGENPFQWTPFDLPVPDDVKPQVDRWQVYATVFPNGSPGGIIETSWGKRLKYTCFFTTDISQFPLESPLLMEQEYSGVADVEEWFCIMLQDGGYRQDLPEYAGVFESEIWYTERMTAEEFVASIEGTTLGILRTLPRERWHTPLVRTECFFKKDQSLAGLLQIAQDLYEEYNIKLATGDY